MKRRTFVASGAGLIATAAGQGLLWTSKNGGLLDVDVVVVRRDGEGLQTEHEDQFTDGSEVVRIAGEWRSLE